MFLFFSNGLGLFGSIAVSVLVTLVLLYACSM
jgi:energy-converting hydrogenase Eha subunit E